VPVFPPLVIVHALAATVWTGGHLVLDLGVLPRALRAQSAAPIRSLEETFEPLGITALAIAFVVVGALIRLGGLS
jgi:putative copper export protein